MLSQLDCNNCYCCTTYLSCHRYILTTIKIYIKHTHTHTHYSAIRIQIVVRVDSIDGNQFQSCCTHNRFQIAWIPFDDTNRCTVFNRNSIFNLFNGISIRFTASSIIIIIILNFGVFTQQSFIRDCVYSFISLRLFCFVWFAKIVIQYAMVVLLCILAHVEFIYSKYRNTIKTEMNMFAANYHIIIITYRIAGDLNI